MNSISIWQTPWFERWAPSMFTPHLHPSFEVNGEVLDKRSVHTLHETWRHLTFDCEEHLDDKKHPGEYLSEICGLWVPISDLKKCSAFWSGKRTSRKIWNGCFSSNIITFASYSFRVLCQRVESQKGTKLAGFHLENMGYSICQSSLKILVATFFQGYSLNVPAWAALLASWTGSYLFFDFTV